MNFDDFLLISSSLVLLSIFFNKMVHKFALPSLLVFLFVGVAAGSRLSFLNYNVIQNIGIISISFILFSGGLSVNFKEIKPVLLEGIVYSTAGVVLSCFFLAIAIHFVCGFSIVNSFLLSAILSSTDAAAVYNILRTKNISLKHNLKPLLEFESASNDPVAVLLVTSVILFTKSTLTPSLLIFDFFEKIIFAVVLGYVFSKTFIFLVSKIKFDFSAFYPILMFSFVMLVYSATEKLGGCGFLAVFLFGLFISKNNFFHKRYIKKFTDALSWFFQIVMFSILGFLANFKASLTVLPTAFLVSLILIFFARPLALYLCGLFFRRSWREKMLIFWVGLRGAAPIFLALFPLTYGLSDARRIFDIVFWVVIFSLLIQGSFTPLFIRLLGLNNLTGGEFEPVLEYSEMEQKNKMIEFKIPKNAVSCNKRARDLKLPKNSILSLIFKRGEYIIPTPDILIEEGDVLFVLMEKSLENTVRARICRLRNEDK